MSTRLARTLPSRVSTVCWPWHALERLASHAMQLAKFVKVSFGGGHHCGHVPSAHTLNKHWPAAAAVTKIVVQEQPAVVALLCSPCRVCHQRIDANRLSPHGGRM